MATRTVSLTDDQCDKLCGALDAFGYNLVNAQALATAALISHMSGKTGKDAMQHTMDLTELLKDALMGDSALSQDMLAKVTGK